LFWIKAAIPAWLSIRCITNLSASADESLIHRISVETGYSLHEQGLSMPH